MVAAGSRGVGPEHHLALVLPPEEVIVRGDPLRLEQVVTNLVSNAIKYSPAGSVVQVALEARGGRATLSIRDQGPGISAADQRGLFEPFRRVGASRSSRPGSGLGLFVVQRIVEAHGGRVEVASAPGRGTEVRVHLDRVEALPAQADASAEPRSALGLGTSRVPGAERRPD